MKRTPLRRRSNNPANIALRKKKAKAETITKIKKRLWQLCRQITINRHGRDCYTCNNRGLSGSNLHTGHFISSSVCSTELRYDLTNLRPQCYRCNIHLSGNWPAFEAHLIRDGIDVEALKRRNEDTKGLQYGRFWLLQKISEYEKLI